MANDIDTKKSSKPVIIVIIIILLLLIIGGIVGYIVYKRHKSKQSTTPSPQYNYKLGSPACISDLCLKSPNDKYQACMQSDGNFVIYPGNTKSTDAIHWQSNKLAENSKLCMQADGNLVAYGGTDGNAYWSSETNTTNPSSHYTAVMKDDGNFVIYDVNDKQIWTTDTKA